MRQAGHWLWAGTEYRTGAIFGCKTENQAIWVDAEQRTSVQDIYAAGECTGFGGSELALAEGEIAGYAAANCPQKAQSAISARARWQRFAHALHTTFALPESLKAATTADTLLCRCEDIRCGEVQNAESWQAAKLASRCGMGPVREKSAPPAPAGCTAGRCRGLANRSLPRESTRLSISQNQRADLFLFRALHYGDAERGKDFVQYCLCINAG